jgi:hypothetical protein
VRSEFPGYYRRTDEELSKIWEDGIFVLDTNVLLNLYRYSTGTREELLGVLRGVRSHLWILHQVAEEFLRNRQTVIRDRKNAPGAPPGQDPRRASDAIDVQDRRLHLRAVLQLPAWSSAASSSRSVDLKSCASVV